MNQSNQPKKKIARRRRADFLTCDKGIGQYSKKYKNLIFGGEFILLFTANVWIKKSLKDEYPKYY